MESLRTLESSLTQWLQRQTDVTVPLTILAFVILVVARKMFARWIMAGLQALLRHMSLEMTEEVRGKLGQTASVLIVVLAAYVLLESIGASELHDDLIRRVLASVAVIAVFSGWYNLAGAFVSLLRSERFGDLRMEAGWMERVARFGVLLFAISALLEIWQVDISAALTGVGVLGAGLAIAMQDLIRNLVAGMNNMSEKRFAKGDFIQVEGVLIGTVEAIDLRSTRIRGLDQVPRHVPNADLSNAVVLNYSRLRNRLVRLSIPLLLSSSEEQILQVRDGLRVWLNESGDFAQSADAPKFVHLEGLSDSAVTIVFFAWTARPAYADYLKVMERLHLKILEIVRAAGTELAYPTQTVHLAGAAQIGEHAISETIADQAAGKDEGGRS